MNSVNYNSQLFPKNHLDTLPGPNNSIADTGCSGNFVPINSPTTNIKETKDGITFSLPNKQTMKATHTCKLDLPMIPEGAREAHVFPNLADPWCQLEHYVIMAAKQSSRQQWY